MATQIVPAPQRADHQGPAAPLPAPAVEVVAAVTTYETAAIHAAQLAAEAASGVDLPAVDVRAWEFAEELMAGAKATLAAAGRLDLIAAPASADVWLDVNGRELLQESDLR